MYPPPKSTDHQLSPRMVDAAAPTYMLVTVLSMSGDPSTAHAGPQNAVLSNFTDDAVADFFSATLTMFTSMTYTSLIARVAPTGPTTVTQRTRDGLAAAAPCTGSPAGGYTGAADNPLPT